MGCDGGTIPKRDELVRTKKKPEQVKFWKFLFRNKFLLSTHSRCLNGESSGLMNNVIHLQVLNNVAEY